MAQHSGSTLTRSDDVRGAGVYPATGPLPEGPAAVRTAAALGHPEIHPGSMPGGPMVERLALLAGRAIFGGYFIYNGINHFVNRKTLAGYARSKEVPLADVAVVGSGALIVAGGLGIVLGARPKTAAALIATFLLGVSPQMHAFWNEQDEQQQTSEMVNFTKNMALVGAALLAAAVPEPWPWRVKLPSSTSEALVPVRS